MAKIGPNERCPCGSGKKFKKCCRDTRNTYAYSTADRASAFAKLEAYIDVFAEDESEDASEEFWGRYYDQADEMPDELAFQSDTLEDLWFAFDRAGEDGVPAETFLAETEELTQGERAFLTALRQSSMHLYEIVDVVPGISLTLRDAIEGGEVTVNERSGSRTLGHHEHVAARVVPRGPSGGPEIEAGILHIPLLLKDAVIAQLREHRARFLDEHRGEDLGALYKTLAPFFHEIWAGAFLAPHVPELKTTDGEDMIPTITRFDVLDATALSRALDGHAELEQDGDGHGWLWSGNNQHGKPTLLLHHAARRSPEAPDAICRARGPRGGRSWSRPVGTRSGIGSPLTRTCSVSCRTVSGLSTCGVTAQQRRPRARTICRMASARR